MNKYNCLSNLAQKNSSLKNKSEEEYRKYLITDLITNEYNTDDIDLRNFKDCFTGMMIKKLYNGYSIEDYFLIRNTIVQIPENLLKNLKDELVALLCKSNLELVKETEKVTSIYEFSFFTERIKVDNKYEFRKRGIKVSDIYLAIIEIDKKIKLFISKYVDNIISNKMNDNDMNLLIEMLDSNDNQDLFQKYEEQFGILRNCQIPVFEKMYQMYLNELSKQLKQRLRHKINIYGFQREKEKEREITDYRHYLAEKGTFEKANKVRVMS